MAAASIEVASAVAGSYPFLAYQVAEWEEETGFEVVGTSCPTFAVFELAAGSSRRHCHSVSFSPGRLADR